MCVITALAFMAKDTDPRFSCKHCGSETFKVVSEVKSYKDFRGAVCSNCGAAVSEDDIRDQARALADKTVRESFKNAGFD